MKSLSKYWPKSVTIRAAIIGAILTGLFGVIIALIESKADLTKEHTIVEDTRIVATLINWGQPAYEIKESIYSFSCTSRIRLSNISNRHTTLSQIQAKIYINDELRAHIWQNEEIGSADTIDQLTFYMDFPSDEPIQIEANSFVDIYTKLYIDSVYNLYEYISVNESYNYSKEQIMWIMVGYIFDFPGIERVTMEPIDCIGVIKLDGTPSK